MAVPVTPGQVPVMIAPQQYVGLMPTLGVPLYSGTAVPQQPQPQQRPQPPPVTAEDVAQVSDSVAAW